MIGSIQMICGMGFIIGTLRALFGWWGKSPGDAVEYILESLALAVPCALVWYGLACAVGGESPE